MTSEVFLSPSVILFFGSLKMSLISFGGVFGVLPVFEQLIVTQNQWVTHREFVDAFALAQFVPGPNVVMFPYLGYRIAGVSGLVASFAGIYLPPFFGMLGLAWSYQRVRKWNWVRQAERALRPIIIGLLISSLLRFLGNEISTLQSSGYLGTVFGFSAVFLSFGLTLTTRLSPVLYIVGIGLLATQIL
jgi:chromate transporter